MKRILLSFVFIVVFCCANAQNKPSIQIIYEQTIEGNGTGWKVEGRFIPYGEVNDGDVLEIGDIELTFTDIHDESHKMKYLGTYFSDKGIYLKHKYHKGEIIHLNLVQRPAGQILSYDSPFFFSDIDFDGKEELLITQWRGGAKSSNRYVAYDLDESSQMKCKPFSDGIEDEFYEWSLADKEVKVLDVLDGVFFYHYSIYSLSKEKPLLVREEGNTTVDHYKL